MKLEGSCHCGAVRFSVRSRHPYPFNLCYCSVCRKTAGGGGYAINLRGDADTLVVEGREHIGIYHARIQNPEDEAPWVSEAERAFCKECGSALWLWDPTWPKLIHPFASAIDTPLPTPPERTHLMLEFKARWVEPCFSPKDPRFLRYPEESIRDWHERLGFIDEDEEADRERV